MSKIKVGADESLELFKNDQTRERWRWVHVAIAHAKEANRAASLMAEDPPIGGRPALRRVR